jgi:hypothetical protein
MSALPDERSTQCEVPKTQVGGPTIHPNEGFQMERCQSSALFDSVSLKVNRRRPLALPSFFGFPQEERDQNEGGGTVDPPCVCEELLHAAVSHSSRSACSTKPPRRSSRPLGILPLIGLLVETYPPFACLPGNAFQGIESSSILIDRHIQVAVSICRFRAPKLRFVEKIGLPVNE